MKKKLTLNRTKCNNKKSQKHIKMFKTTIDLKTNSNF